VTDTCIDAVASVINTNPIIEESIFPPVSDAEVEDLITAESKFIPASNIENVPEDLIEEATQVYEGIEEIHLLDGVAYVAVKKGYSLSVGEVVVEEVKNVQLVLTSHKDSYFEEKHIFPNVYTGANSYWKNILSESVDVEVEFEGSPQDNRTNINNPGLGKKELGQSVTSNILRAMANTKDRNRARSKQAKKSRAKNRK
jgi:hypothetical protein